MKPETIWFRNMSIISLQSLRALIERMGGGLPTTYKADCCKCGCKVNITIERTSWGYGLIGGRLYESESNELYAKCPDCYWPPEHMPDLILTGRSLHTPMGPVKWKAPPFVFSPGLVYSILNLHWETRTRRNQDTPFTPFIGNRPTSPDRLLGANACRRSGCKQSKSKPSRRGTSLKYLANRWLANRRTRISGDGRRKIGPFANGYRPPKL